MSVKYKLEGHNTVLLSAETKLNLHWVATGSRDVPDKWYRSLDYSSPQKAGRQPSVDANSTPLSTSTLFSLVSHYVSVSRAATLFYLVFKNRLIDGIDPLINRSNK